LFRASGFLFRPCRARLTLYFAAKAAADSNAAAWQNYLQMYGQTQALQPQPAGKVIAVVEWLCNGFDAVRDFHVE